MEIDYTAHWNTAYQKNSTKKLGWYEESSVPTLALVEKTAIPKSASILNVGVGSSTLIDDLLAKGYSNLIANDLAEESLQSLKKRLGEAAGQVQFIVDDLINPSKLDQLKNIDLWNDRAVLHFFLSTTDQKAYFDLLKKVLKPNGFVILAAFSLEGAKKCCSLEVFRYNTEMLQKHLGAEFTLLESFNHTFVNPNGDSRPYVYTLFQRKEN